MRVLGTSLEPRIHNGATVDALIGEDCAFRTTKGNILLFVSGAQSIPLAKVVAAEPGDRWSVGADGGIIVNDEPLRNSAGAPYRLTADRSALLRLYQTEYAGVIPEGTYLLMGERPDGSLDSSQLGLVHRKDVIGKIERVHE
ncbi:hypothetical protein AUP43_04725 [Oceanibaculum pacificum]|uniref:Signal peptidase I n=2 Tax=Oceanibaculum pacificum TaxID=580166 RepID=A0A154WG33_9PROT|nr:hypothetical protein AUP43_04725 [Oceanibaculum pacificum]